jgi:LPXTG-motif cell wall-anchored protein
VGYVEADFHGKKGTVMWAKRLVIGAGLAVASFLMVPGVAGAGTTSCYTGCTPPTIAATSVGVAPAGALPYSSTTSAATTTNPEGTSSLPFTGADVEELAVVGVGAVLAGGLLLRRRRSVA